MTRWKGVDDAIAAFRAVDKQLPRWELDIIGDGPELQNLRDLAGNIPGISFLAPLDYGEAFFKKLRTYEVVIIPTRGLEETRIAYDAAASGCVIVHSNTPTLQSALRGMKAKWEFDAGNPSSLASSLILVCKCRDSWMSAALAGIAAMRDRTILEMHQRRFKYFKALRLARNI